MEAGKRTQAIPFDFKYALNANQLTLWSLLPHLDPPTSDGMDASKTPVETMVVVAPRIEVQEKIINKDEELMKQFSLRLRGEQTQTRLPYAARKLPTLPSRHTYKSTPAVSERVTGPKTIRERATEESRLSEEALRRLVGARQNRVKNHALSILSSNHAQVSGQGRGNGTGAGDIKSAYQNCWDMLVEQAQDDEDRVDLKRTDFSGPLINAESRYWRKGARVGKKSSVSVGGRGSG